MCPYRLCQTGSVRGPKLFRYRNVVEGCAPLRYNVALRVTPMAKKKTTQPEDSTLQSDTVAPARRSPRRAATPRSTRSKTPSGSETGTPIDTAHDLSSASSGPSRQEIAEAAYHRYLKRGGGDGRDFDDWLEAERELRGRS